jgi:hypothetical protein
MLSNLEDRSTLDIECAERELIGIAVRKPTLWAEVSHIRPEWFHQWSDQAIWRALQFCRESNDGHFDVEVVNGWFQEYFPDDAVALLHRLAEIANCLLHAEHLEFNLELLEGSGRRIALKRWATHIVEMCDTGRPMSDICHVAATLPVQSGGAE